MIEIFGGQTPNVFKPLIALAELEVAYERVPVDISNGEQFKPEFLAISPNNRVPAIVDYDPADGGPPLSVFESGAILLYLADKHNELIPSDARRRNDVIQWVMWQMAGQGPMAGQAGHFLNIAPETPYAIKRYSDEINRLYRVLNTRLEGRTFIAGDYSIADIACWPWVFYRDQHGVILDDYPEVKRWFEAVGNRTAVKTVIGDYEPPARVVLTEEQRAVLFGHSESKK